jgi:hypothetical protein
MFYMKKEKQFIFDILELYKIKLFQSCHSQNKFHFWKLEFWIFGVCNYYFMCVGQNFDLPTTLF